MNDKCDMKGLHAIFMQMIKEFHDYCVLNHLTYYMVGGTLLGAARNKGFIPWDDDVDFAMPRPDYQKLLQSYNGNLRLVSNESDRNFLYPYAKMFHPDSFSIEVEDDEVNIHSSVFLSFDIYPIDGVGNDINIAKRHTRKIQSVRTLCYINQTTDRSPKFISRTFERIVRLLPSALLMRYQIKLMQRYAYRGSILVTRWRMPVLSKNIVSKDVFEPAVLMPFENMELPAPAKYHSYLSMVYGDYMTPTRENQGARHALNSSELSLNLNKIIKNETDVLQ